MAKKRSMRQMATIPQTTTNGPIQAQVKDPDRDDKLRQVVNIDEGEPVIVTIKGENEMVVHYDFYSSSISIQGSQNRLVFVRHQVEPRKLEEE